MTVVSLSEKQRLLREQILRREGVTAAAPRRIPRRAGSGPAPLSFGQSRLWFLHQLDPRSTAYNLSETVGLRGHLDPGALGRALAEVVRRHEALRTVFAQSEGGEPVQTVGAARPPFLVADLTGLPSGLRKAAASRAAAQLAAAPFDLERGPVLRAAVLRLGAEEDQGHVLTLALHHIATDGWSMGLLLRELVTLYEAFLTGTPSPLPDLPLQYADFAAWQRENLSGQAQERHLAYWKERLAGAPTLLQLATDRPRPASPSFRGGEEPVGVEAATAAALRDLARREGATPFMAVLAVLGALLQRYTRQDEVLIGSPSANRGRPELEGLIGFFVNTLVLRVDLSGDPGLATLIGRARETVLGAEAHQDLPFEQIVDALDLPRDLSRTPLFQVLLAYQNLPPVAERPRSLALLPFGAAAPTARFELSFILSDGERGLGGMLSYRSELFDASTARQIARHFETLLRGAVDRPATPLSELPLLSEAERRQLARDSGSAGASPAGDACLHDLFAEQAARTPGAPAVADEQGAWTYAELARRVRRLAARLRAAGVTPDQPVLLCARRGAGLVAGLLGILEAGGAYLAVEPDLPQARQELLAADARATVAVTERQLGDALPAGLRRVFLDPEDLDGPEEPGERPRAAVTPGHLAYVLYTSGSTGRPKGVMVEHRHLTAYVRGALERLAPPPGASFATVSSFAADLGHTSIFAALLHGGCLHVIARERLADADALAERMERQPVDGLKIVPSHLAALLTAERPERSLPRRLLVFGGEPLPWSLVERVRALAPECRVLNHYGPTETTVGVLAGAVPERDPGSPLGRPLGQTRVWVVDRHQLTPPGVPGELWVGGPQVTRGYLGRPDLTAERFVPDPFGGGAGERLYRTGDLVRVRPDGPVEFLGRIDDQVKVRGFRIEPGEIEAALRALPGVREAAVVAREERSDEGPGDRRLVAYVVGDAAAGSGVAALRQALRERLPDFMVPSALVALPALPLTPNGKVDRKALPAPEPLPADESSPAPRTPVEEVLAGIWAGLLGREQVGAGDHFFDLGGHSLLATQVMSRLRAAFGVEMPLRDLFEAPVLADLAARVEAARQAGAGRPAPPLVPLAPSLRKEPLPLSFAQQRLWFIDQLEPGTTLYNIPVVLRVEGPLDSAVLTLCLGEIVRRHEVLRTVFAAHKGSPVQVIRPPAPFELPVVDLSGLPADGREALARTLAGEAAGRPFDLARGPLFRGALLRLTGEDHIAVLAMHHIVSDGWSMGILIREVGALYRAFLDGRPSPLPELPVQYADFAAWQHAWLDAAALEGLAEHWRRRLAGAPEQLDLPGARPRPAVRSARGGTAHRHLTAPLLERLQALGRRESATLFMTLLAPLQALLHARTGATDVVVGTDVAGRDRRETEGLIGFFINQLPLRADLSGDPTLRELLGRVRDTALDAYAHQDLPFDHLVEALRVKPSLQVAPVFQVKLVLRNAHQERLDLPGLTLRAVPVEDDRAQIDLHWSVAEVGRDLWLTLSYSADLFDEPLIHRLLDQYEAWLRAFAERPEARLGEVAAELARAERDRQAERDLELRSRGLGKLRSLRRQAEEPAGPLQERKA